RVDEQGPGLLVPPARVLLHHAPDDAALGMEYGQAGADLVRDREQVQLDPEPARVPRLAPPAAANENRAASTASRRCARFPTSSSRWKCRCRASLDSQAVP